MNPIPLLLRLACACVVMVTSQTGFSAESPAAFAPKYDDLITTGHAFLKAGKLNEAYVAAMEAGKLDKNRFESYALAGLVQARQNQTAEALKFLKEALTRAPEAKKAKLWELQKMLEQEPSSSSPPAVGVIGGPKAGMPFENTLRMKFVPVAGTEVLFCIWETRRRDYAAFSKASPRDDPSQNPISTSVLDTAVGDHPIGNVSWNDAVAFCEWLTQKEQTEGVISRAAFYRLPKDLEWSAAAGLTGETGSTPRARNREVSDVYPWGSQWPPPSGAGNYADLTFRTKFPRSPIIEDYRDGFAETAPVGSFPANSFGLYDMGGNVWELCEDGWDDERTFRVIRGAAWNVGWKGGLPSASRDMISPGHRNGSSTGFRCVLVVGERAAEDRKPK